METRLTGYLLDTTVLIDLLRGHARAANFVDDARQVEVSLCVSVISAMELIAGCRNKADVEQADRLLTNFELIHLSTVDSVKAYALMLLYSKSHGLTIPDALIAATAITLGLELLTDNVRHFIMIDTLKVTKSYP